MKYHRKGLVRTLLVTVLFLNSVFVPAQQATRSEGEAKPERQVSVERQQGDIEAAQNATRQNKARIEFAAPVSLYDALTVAARQNLTITQVQHSFVLGDQTFVGLYPVEAGSSPDAIAADMMAKHRGFLQDVSREPDEEPAEYTPSEPATAKRREKLSAQAEEALASSYQGELLVDGITVLGVQGQIEALKEESPLISKIESGVGQQASASAQEAPDKKAEPQAASSVDENTWVPVVGKVVTNEATEGGRYVRQEMRWSNVSGFGANSTYEHDFFLKNSGGTLRGPGTYLSRSDTLIDRIPKVEYYASNLPRPYLDSRFGDGNDEVAFTVGCAKASDIKAGEDYISYIRTKNGDASQDDGKLQAQLGHRSPSWCYDTLCSFEDKQVSRVVIVPAWDVPVPGVKNWDRRRAPAAHFSMGAQSKSANDGGTLNLSAPVNGSVMVSLRSTSTQGTAPITKHVWKSNGTQICSNSSTCNYNFGTASNTISLTVTDSEGKSSTATGSVKLAFQTVGPTAHFSMSAQGKSANDGATLNLSVPVNGSVAVSLRSTSTQGSGSITRYVWKSNGTQICSNSSTCSYNFGTANNTISLTVTDGSGRSSTATGSVKLTFQSVAPTASFSMSAQSKSANNGGTLNLSVPTNGNVTVSFKSTSRLGTAPITRYVWKSNGTQICSNSSTCNYNFGTASNTISLTVTDSTGRSSTATGLVKLAFQPVGPTAHFSMGAQGKSANDGGTLRLSVPVNSSVTVSFRSTGSRGSASITKYVWRSNGTQICSNSSSCSYRFGTTSNTITLTVTDSNGKSSTATGLLRLR